MNAWTILVGYVTIIISLENLVDFPLYVYEMEVNKEDIGRNTSRFKDAVY